MSSPKNRRNPLCDPIPTIPVVLNDTQMENFAEGKIVTVDAIQNLENEDEEVQDERREAIHNDGFQDFLNKINNDEAFDVLSKKMTVLDADKRIRKQILTDGKGALVSLNDTVLIDYSSYYDGNPEPFDSTFITEKPTLVCVQETLLGLQIALQSMRLGETARFIIESELAFKNLGVVPRIPPEADVLIYIEVLKIVPDENNAVGHFDNENQYPKLIKTFKQEGADAFAHGQLELAAEKYNDALRYLKELINLNKCQITYCGDNYEVEKLKDQLHVNLAVVYNKMKRPEFALKHCKEALNNDPKNKKARFHCGRAYFNLTQYKKAKEEFSQGQKDFPKCLEFHNELTKIYEIEADDSLIKMMDKSKILL